MDVLRLCTTSNVGMPGVWRFEIRSGEITCPGRGDRCMTGRPGVCGPGTRVCVSPDESECRADASPGDESCNGLDDDCDGRTDEELGSATCGVGECTITVERCAFGRPQPCVPLPPRLEACNLLDDDCDGSIDDLDDLSCGVGACASSAPACVAGAPGRCVPGTPTPERCNGVDDDCNGLVDDRLAGCDPPDAGPPDAGPPDAGPLDASDTDAGRRCVGPDCPSLSIQGRAGPLGCACGVAGRPPGVPPLGWALAAALVLAIAVRRLRRR
jgi:MYXO-CTERM domain-containing protein